MKVVVYSTSDCPWCQRTKELLTQRGVTYVDKDIEQDERAARELRRRYGQRGVPVIVIDDEVIVGFDRRRLESLTQQTAEAYIAAQRPRLGAAVADAEAIAARRGRSPVAGAYAGAVTPDSPAALAGLEPGDVITCLNGRGILHAADVERVLKDARTGDALEISFLRDGKQLRGHASM